MNCFRLKSITIVLAIHSFIVAPMDNKQPTAFSIDYGLASMQGRRPTMEDAHKVKVPFINDTSSFFAIYDGHGGSSIANYCADTIHTLVKKLFLSHHTMDKALTEGIEKADKELDSSALKDKAQMSGSTAVIAIIQDTTLSVAHVGDARAILCRNGKALALTKDHKPDSSFEKQRIEKAGGHIFVWGVPRVGGLAVSRAIGDHALQTMGVIATPEVCSIDLKPEDTFLILACDGIFEPNISCQDAVDIVQKSLEANKNNPEAAKLAAIALIKAAYSKGSGDNLSAIVILLKREIKQTPEKT